MTLNSVFNIPSSIEKDFFKHWCLFTRPLHRLTNSQIDLAAALLKKRYELCKSISDQNIVDKVLFSKESRNEIMNSLGITVYHYRFLIGVLKKNKVIVENKINPKFIPNIKDDAKEFNVLLTFSL